jgi:deoxyxylulose-5-phosphate synthase
METQETKDLRAEMIARYTSKIEAYENKLDPGYSILERCNQIVQIGAYTIGTDEDGKVKLCLVDFPTQFSDKAIAEIKAMTFTNGHGERIHPTVYGVREWYRKELELAKGCLLHLQTASDKG